MTVVFAAIAVALFSPRAAIKPLPSSLSDVEFWNMVREFSEPSGFFRSDNFTSNETTFQHVIPELRLRTRKGGVYLGVGPDQNFTYIAAVRPKLAFIVDIRRQAMLQHLMYKAIFELSDNRAEFLSKLFSREIEPDTALDGTAEALFETIGGVESDVLLSRKNLEAILDRLQRHHQFSLSAEDRQTIEYVYRNFVQGGPLIRYSFPNQNTYRRFPTYADLMTQTDAAGENHSYLASEENFRFVKQLQHDNRLVPLVGNFAGDDTLRAVGQYLEDHGATVSVFYTSNVEFYLFQSDDWKRFFNNVADLPLDENSTFIRAYFNTDTYRFSRPEVRSVTLLDGMKRFMDDFHNGDIRRYRDITNRSR
jgi:hypothetical protein